MQKFSDWVNWFGGSMPVAPDQLVQVQMRDPALNDDIVDRADALIWGAHGGSADITRFRIAMPSTPLDIDFDMMLTAADEDAQATTSAWKYRDLVSIPDGAAKTLAKLKQAEERLAQFTAPEAAANDSLKPVNPKDVIGSKKLPLHLVPATVMIYAAMAFAEGASKYGAFNWRVTPVRYSVYMAAHDRHQAKLDNGQWADPKTQVPHLASMIACLGIIADAKLCGTLIDDRSPTADDIEELIADAEVVVAHVVALNAHMAPHHCTINDAKVAA